MLKIVALLAALAAASAQGGGEPTMDCPDINDDGVISVGDILAMLSAFGSDDAAADINDDGTVSVTDILGALSSFGDECSLGSGDDDPQANCETWNDGCNTCTGDGFTSCTERACFTEGTPFCALSTDGTVCRGPEDCGEGGDGGDGESSCAMGEECGGQVANECGSACPAACDAEDSFCASVCVNGFFCPNGQTWDVGVSSCVSPEDCSVGGGDLPPGVAMGRPFSLPGAFASAVVEERTSDWM